MALKDDNVADTTLDVQHDGSHYKNFPIQPIEFCHKNQLGTCESFAIKHITRHKYKGEGVTDLKKAIHYLQMLLEMDYGVVTMFDEVNSPEDL